MVIAYMEKLALTEDSVTDVVAFVEEMDMTAVQLATAHLEERIAFVTLRTAVVAVVAP
jgi:hypothetical protein